MNEISSPEQPMLTRRQVAELLQVTPVTVARLVKRGILKEYKFNSRMVRYSSKEIAELIEKHTQ